MLHRIYVFEIVQSKFLSFMLRHIPVFFLLFVLKFSFAYASFLIIGNSALINQVIFINSFL